MAEEENGDDDDDATVWCWSFSLLSLVEEFLWSSVTCCLSSSTSLFRRCSVFTCELRACFNCRVSLSTSTRSSLSYSTSTPSSTSLALPARRRLEAVLATDAALTVSSALLSSTSARTTRRFSSDSCSDTSSRSAPTRAMDSPRDKDDAASRDKDDAAAFAAREGLTLPLLLSVLALTLLLSVLPLPLLLPRGAGGLAPDAKGNDRTRGLLTLPLLPLSFLPLLLLLPLTRCEEDDDCF
mmetsp:Transcript_47435/g.80953  ORF Transcript_47435/g.80953 Transcript_47435/m.80953 type:complete len:239 (-) Transcript_47435:377-1093(-)